MILSGNLHARIFENYHAGKEYTNGRKYRYTLQYHPLALMHTWIMRQDKRGGEWEFVEPLSEYMQFTPHNSTKRYI